MALKCNCQGASISISHPLTKCRDFSFLKISINIHQPSIDQISRFSISENIHQYPLALIDLISRFSFLKICHIFWFHHVADRKAQFYINFTFSTDYHNFLELNVTYLTTFSINFTFLKFLQWKKVLGSVHPLDLPAVCHVCDHVLGEIYIYNFTGEECNI